MYLHNNPSFFPAVSLSSQRADASSSHPSLLSTSEGEKRNQLLQNVKYRNRITSTTSMHLDFCVNNYYLCNDISQKSATMVDMTKAWIVSSDQNSLSHSPEEWLQWHQTGQLHCQRFPQWGSSRRGWRSGRLPTRLRCPRCRHRCHRRGWKSPQSDQLQTWSNLRGWETNESETSMTNPQKMKFPIMW